MSKKYQNFLISFLILVISSLFFSCSRECRVNYWVAPNGNDSANGSVNHPFLTLDGARNAIRAKPKSKCTVNVNMEGGTYRLSEPFILEPQDSGTQRARIVYKADAGANVIISGAEKVTGWIMCTTCDVLGIWQAQTNVQTALMPRQLYVNGVRATRARTPIYPNYYTPVLATGYFYLATGADPNPSPSTWTNPTAIEAVTATQWKMMRCPVADINTISSTEANIIMQQPCWQNANVFPLPWNFYLLNWWENALQFLDEPNEWYLDPVSKILYYMPSNSENPKNLDIELPLLETLIKANGTVDEPVSYINFEGLNFMYATWLEPSSSEGYALDQSGFHLVGPYHLPNLIGHDENTVRTPGNLSFNYAQNISFNGNTFSHMGAVGLDFVTGSQNNRIVNNTFNDISAAAIQLGGVAQKDHHPKYPSQLTTDNQIVNNVVQYTGQEFYDAPGIYVGFTTRSLVQYNTIQHTSWSGIAIGWGWGLFDPGGFAGLPHGYPYMWGVYLTPSAAHQNRILNNKIEYFLEQLWDGGAIYNSGFTGDSMEDGMLIEGNVALYKNPSSGGNTFYTDGGSRYITVQNNVSLFNPQGTFNFGPCGLSSSFPILCLSTGIVPYGTDMGGCVTYGDELFEKNYLLNQLSFYDICTDPATTYFYNYPINMTFIDNVQVIDYNQVPASILANAGAH